MSEKLQSGQTAEVTSSGAQPNPAWLNFVVTAKARTNIRHFWCKIQLTNESVALGPQATGYILTELGSGIDQLSDNQKELLLSDTGMQTFNEVLEEIGLGNRVSFLTAHQLLAETDKDGKSIHPKNATHSPLAIRGSEGFRINLAIAYTGTWRFYCWLYQLRAGIVVHTDNCHNSLIFVITW